MEIKLKRYKIQIISFLTAFVTLLICSKCSFLYVFNDWVDANCFMTVGKSMFTGNVLYRDIYEQKGPLLYFLYGIGWLFSDDSFHVIFIFEVVAGTVFLYYSYCTARILWKNISWIWIPIMGAMVYSSVSFAFGGSAEEFCLPFLAYALYTFVAYYFNDKEKERIISYKKVFFLGIFGGCVLWIKYTFLGLYIGFVVAISIEYMLTGKRKELFQSAGVFLLGTVVASAPWFLYFAYNHALTDLWNVYFYNNMFLYSASSGKGHSAPDVKKIFGKGLDNIQYSFFLIVGMFSVLVQNMKKKPLYVVGIFTIIVSTVFFTMGLGKIYKYYFLPMAVFVPLGVPMVQRIVERIASHVKITPAVRRTAFAAVCVALLPAMYGLSPNTYMMSMTKEELPQYQFATIINASEEKTLLNYGWLDGGFYEVTGIVPVTRFFCKVNMELEEMIAEQNRVLEQGDVKYVVAREKDLHHQFDKYTLLTKSTYYPGERNDRTWYLYERKDSNYNQAMK